MFLIKTERVKLTQFQGPCSNQKYHCSFFVLHSGNIDVTDGCNPCSCGPLLQRGAFGRFMYVTLAALLLAVIDERWDFFFFFFGLVCCENKPYAVMLGMCGLLHVPASWFLSILADFKQMWQESCDSERIITFLKFHENRWVDRVGICYWAGRAVM